MAEATGGGAQGGGLATEGITARANDLADISKEIAGELIEAEKIMAPAKAEKQIAGKGS